MSKVYIICGSPASGKTTYGKKLAKEKRATFIDIDQSTERLVRLALSKSGRNEYDRDSKYFKENFREPIYQTLFDIAKDNLDWTNVVLVGPFTQEIRLKNWPEILVKELGGEVEIHYVYCNSEVRYNRMLGRKSKRDKAKLSDWESFNKYYGDEKPPEFKHVFIDTSNF